MAYQTGVSSTLSDLIDTLITFCESNGFTRTDTWSYLDESVWPNVTYNAQSLRKNDIYFNFAVPEGGPIYLRLNTSTSVVAGLALGLQPGASPDSCRVDNLAGPHVGYHFFTDESGVNVAVEIVTNVFVHFNFGELQKNGGFNGGQYVTGTSIMTLSSGGASMFNSYSTTAFGWSNVGGSGSNYGIGYGHVRTPIGGPTASLGAYVEPTYAWATGLAANAGRPLVEASPNAFNGRSVLVPINIVQGSSGRTGPYYQLGTVGNARFINIANLNPKEMVNTDWMVFPLSQKNGPGTSYLNSGNYGIAYRV